MIHNFFEVITLLIVLNVTLALSVEQGEIPEEPWRKHLLPPNVRVQEREMAGKSLFAFGNTSARTVKRLMINGKPFDCAVASDGGLSGGFFNHGRTKNGWNVISAMESGSGAYTITQTALLLYRQSMLLQISSEQYSNQLEDASASGSLIVKCPHFGPPFAGATDTPTAINEKGYVYSKGQMFELPEFTSARFSGNGTITGCYEKVVDGQVIEFKWKVNVPELKLSSERRIRRIPIYKM